MLVRHHPLLPALRYEESAEDAVAGRCRLLYFAENAVYVESSFSKHDEFNFVFFIIYSKGVLP